MIIQSGVALPFFLLGIVIVGAIVDVIGMNKSRSAVFDKASLPRGGAAPIFGSDAPRGIAPAAAMSRAP
jgi:hypothetical protein